MGIGVKVHTGKVIHKWVRDMGCTEKKGFLLEVHLVCIFIFCENINSDILIRSNVNGNLKNMFTQV